MSDRHADARLALEQSMIAANVAPEKARSFALAKYPGIVSPDPDAMRGQLEAEHEAAADRLMLAFGFEVVRLSQRRASKITAGVPDRKYYHRRRRLAFWYEAKAAWGEQRPAQREFQAMCEACGETYVKGELAELQAWLVAAGVATWDGALLVPTPIAAPDVAERAS